MNFKRYASVVASLLALSAFIGINANSAAGQELRWKTIMGVKQLGDQVGVGSTFQTGAGNGFALGGAPWETIGGSADVNLSNGKVNFDVKGLILAVWSVPSLAVAGVPIGTPGPVTEVKGTLVCDVDGTANGGSSALVDTIPTTLDAQGNAH